MISNNNDWQHVYKVSTLFRCQKIKITFNNEKDCRQSKF